MSRLSLIGVSKTKKTPFDLTTVEGVVMHYTERIINELKENLKSSNASYSLSQSIQVEFEVTTTMFGYIYHAKISGEDYATYVNSGRGPGKPPPVTPIIEWIRNKETFKLKGMERIGETKKRGLRKGTKVTIQDIQKQAAFAIATNIGKYGTQGTGFIDKVLTPDLYADMNRDFAAALQKDIKVTIGLISKLL